MNILKRLYLTTLRHLGVGPNRWSALIGNYTRLKDNLLKDNGKGYKDPSYVRSNLLKDFKRPHFTWAMFVKGILILNPITASLKWKITWDHDLISHKTIEKELPINRKAGEELYHFYQELREQLKLSKRQVKLLGQRYVNNPKHRLPKCKITRRWTLTNLEKDLKRPRYTWKLLERGIALLEPKHIQLTLCLTWRHSEPTYLVINWF